MIDPLLAVSVFRDVRPGQDGFQPSWLYVVLCLAVPAVLGVLMAMITAGLQKLTGKHDNGEGDV